LQDGNVVDSMTRKKLIDEQKSDDSLLECRRMADAHRNNFAWIDGVLYHYDSIAGQTVQQLVLPTSRRNEILIMAHDKCGLHKGRKKTSERIRYSFFWPKMKQDIHNYCSSCLPCQQTRRLVKTDRVPIKAIPRNNLLPGEHLIMDVVGLIEPKSSAGHRYLLCIIDVCTRWPSVYLLKNLTAKSVCDSLLDLISVIGIASRCSFDNATNFRSKLTQEFLSRFGCSPVFATPRHPQAQGLVERFNCTLKRALHYVIHENARQWHKLIPFIVWSFREITNDTTSVPPCLLMYGRLPKGPLSLIKETWTGERALPSTLSKSETQYMSQLKRNLELVHDLADAHSTPAQPKYVRSHNAQAQDKHFQAGDQVIVLEPDSTHKLISQWQTGVVAKVCSPYS
jgi:hypothetical protein